MKNKTVIIIAGPTASGKTAAAIRLAQWLDTPIISADSRQCFRELNIGVAKPSPEQLRSVPHYFINSHSIADPVSAALFEELALDWAHKIFSDHDLTVMVGGTGLYIRAFCEGLDAIPPVDPVIRLEIREQYETLGLDWLQQQVREQDPVFYTTGEIQNPQRMMRALEVKLGTGQSVTSFRTASGKQRPFEVIKIGLALPKEELWQNINTRTEQMVQDKLLEEVQSLVPFRDRNALRTVGYTEIFNYLDGKLSFDEAVAQIKKNTRQYAKRQLTWFRKDPAFQWIHPTDLESLKKIIKR